MAKVRVYELAKEFGVESKAVMAKLQEMGEFVRSASSTIEAPVVKKLRDAYPAGGEKATRPSSSSRPASPARPAPAPGPARPAAPAPAPEAAAAPKDPKDQELESLKTYLEQLIEHEGAHLVGAQLGE